MPLDSQIVALLFVTSVPNAFPVSDMINRPFLLSEHVW